MPRARRHRSAKAGAGDDSFSVSGNQEEESRSSGRDEPPPPPPPQDHYEVLGLDRDADEGDIRRAYRRLAIRNHPDKMINASEADQMAAEERFRTAAEAHAVLSDPARRKMYDQHGEEGVGLVDAVGKEMQQAVEDAVARSQRHNRRRESSESSVVSVVLSWVGQGDLGSDDFAHVRPDRNAALFPRIAFWLWFLLWFRESPVYESEEEVLVSFGGTTWQRLSGLRCFWRPYMRNHGAVFFKLYAVSALTDWMLGSSAPVSTIIASIAGVLWFLFGGFWASLEAKDRPILMITGSVALVIALFCWWLIPARLLVWCMFYASIMSIMAERILHRVAYLYIGPLVQLSIIFVIDSLWRPSEAVAFLAEGYWWSMLSAMCAVLNLCRFLLVFFMSTLPALHVAGFSFKRLGSVFEGVKTAMKVVLALFAGAIMLIVSGVLWVSRLADRFWVLRQVKPFLKTFLFIDVPGHVPIRFICWWLDSFLGIYVERFLYLLLTPMRLTGALASMALCFALTYLLPQWVAQVAGSLAMGVHVYGITLHARRKLGSSWKGGPIATLVRELIGISFAIYMVYADIYQRSFFGLTDWMPLPDDRPEEMQGRLLWQWPAYYSCLVAFYIFVETKTDDPSTDSDSESEDSFSSDDEDMPELLDESEL